jgi:hypothetical protein
VYELVRHLTRPWAFGQNLYDLPTRIGQFPFLAIV